MDNFLADAAQSGRKSSSGEFTISHHEALRKLRDFQLPRMGAFAANLVAAVVLGGGSRIHVGVTETVITFIFDQPCFSHEDLDMLFLSPFQSGAPMWRKEMAIAANGTLGLPLKYLSLESWDANQKTGWELRSVGGDQQTVGPVSRPLGKTSQSRFSLHFGYQRGFRMLNYSHPVQQELRDRCRYAPLDIRLNSRLLSEEPITGRTEIARRVWRSESRAPGSRLPGKAKKSEEVTHEEPFSALFEVAPRDKGEVTLVVNGVSFPAPAETFELPGWARLIVAAPHLAKDLSQASLTMGKPLRHIADWAGTKLPLVLEDRCRTFKDLGSGALRHFHFCLDQTYPRKRPQAVQDWFDHQDLVQQARSTKKFVEMVEKAKALEDPLRVRSLWRALRQAQWREYCAAWSERDWGKVKLVAGRLELVAAESVPLSGPEKESLMTGLCLASSNSAGPLLADSSRDVLWSSGRRVLALWLLGRKEEALEATEEVTGFWKHYLKFQLLMPSQKEALRHLERAISESYRAVFALNDLVEIQLMNGEYSRALDTRRNFLRRNPPAKIYWNQIMRLDARAHGSRSQFAFWTALTGLAEITRAGRVARVTVDRLGRYEHNDWLELLEESEKIQLSNTKWRFLFHRALWALRCAGEWDIPRRYLFRRLLKASYSEDGQSPLVPALSVL